MTMFASDDQVCSTLGMDDEGRCLWHPNISIAQSRDHFSICRICASELQSGEIRQRKSMAYPIQELKDMHNDQETWSGVNRNGEAETIQEEEKKDLDATSKASANDEPLQPNAVLPPTRQVIERAAQVQQWSAIDNDKQLENLRKQIQELEEHNGNLQIQVAEQTEEISRQQEALEVKERTINQELRMIKSIAMKRAERRGSQNTSSSASPSPKVEAVAAIEPTDEALKLPNPEEPPRLPARKTSDKHTFMNVIRTNKSSDDNAMTMRGNPPKLPMRLASAPEYEDETDLVQQIQNTTLSPRKSQIPPNMPQGLASQDMAVSFVSDVTPYSMASFTTTESAPLNDMELSGEPPMYRESLGSTSSVDLFRGSAATLDTETDEVIYKRPQQQEEEEEDSNILGSGQFHPPSIAEGDEENLSAASISDSLVKRKESSQEISFVPRDSEVSSSERGAPQSSPQEKGIPPPPPTDTPNSFVRIPSIDVPELPIQSESPKPNTSSQEIEFDASAAFKFHPHDDIINRRASVADVVFDSSEQLMVEASQAVSSGNMPTPHSVKFRKSLGSPKKPAPKKLPKGKNSPMRTATSKSAPNKEINFEAPDVVGKTALERMLEGDKFASIERDAIKDKTEQQILDERVFGMAAVASAEDEEDDNYDEFKDMPVSKGYLEVQRAVNLSPVSALTTGSYLRDGGMPDDDDDVLSPRKGLHQGAFKKRLPFEEDFDSADDDTDRSSFPSKGGGVDSGENTSSLPKMTNLIPVELEKKDSFNTQDVSFSNPKPVKPSEGVAPANAEKIKPKLPKKTYEVSNQNVQDRYGDGGLYTGSVSVEDKLPHGYGKMVYDNERQYEGDWRDGRWHGIGCCVNPNGDCYEGKFVYDARHGHGVYNWKNGNVYKGDFFEDKRQGKGTFHFANGNVYEGSFVNGVFEGLGQYNFEGGFYEGQWRGGRYHGSGYLLFADGSIYKGEFLDGVAHGHGEETSADGTYRKGIWENGRPLTDV